TGGTCNIAVELVATTTGTKDNTTGAVSATESGPGTTSNTASVGVTSGPAVSPPTLTKGFGTASIPLGQTTALTFTVANPNPSATLFNISFSDPLPSGLQV